MSIPLVKYVRGFAFPGAERFSVENITSAMDYVHKDGDILVCSFPKAGTTWMQCVIWQILHKCEPYPRMSEFTLKIAPFIERTGSEPVKALTAPRFYKTHIQYHAMKINEKAKYIYIYRNPADTLVSYFHFARNTGDLNISFEQFFDLFLEGKIPYGDYIDHVMSFYKHKNDPHLLLVSYEEMSADRRGQLLRVAKFLGENYYNDLVNDEAFLQKTLELTSFDYMKSALGDPKKDERAVHLFRKGIVGDGETVLSESMKKKLRTFVQKKTKDTDLFDGWEL